MELNLVIGQSYVVSTATECTVTDADGRLLCTATAGQQQAFVASTSVVTVSDDAAAVTAVFKGAPALGGGGGSSYTLTAEAVKEVVPLRWNNYSFIYGTNSSSSSYGVGVGWNNRFSQYGIAVGHTTNAASRAVVVGGGCSAAGIASIALGNDSQAQGGGSICAGGYTTYNGSAKYCRSEGAGSIALGLGAQALNTKDSSGAVVVTSNAIALGCAVTATAADSVCVGAGAQVSAGGGIAIGAGAVCADVGAVVFASYSSDRSYKTQLYFAGAGTPLAIEYYNGEAMIGYIVTDSAGNTVACGTNKLSALFPDNSTTQAATVDDDGDWVMPTLFEPNDVKAEPRTQSYTPLPVYPIVEPEIEELTEEES